MGGLFSTPTAPVQSNEGQIMLAEAQMKQNELLYKQQADADSAQRLADDAQAENLRGIELRDAEAQKEREERERRAAKGKKDLLYGSAIGVSDDEEDDMMALGA